MFLSDVQCRYWVPAPAAWQQQPATTQQQQLVEFYVAFSTGHGKQLGATALHPCRSVVKMYRIRYFYIHTILKIRL
jgi:hypothetical protein